MNYLAHLFLAEDHAASRVGNLLGDFVTGTPESLRERFPAEIVAGIVRHRTLDVWADAHPVTAMLKECIDPSRRRFAGAIIDVIHDHFLTRRWADHSPDLPLPDFRRQVYAALREYRTLLPDELGGDLEEKISSDWLSHYGMEECLDDIFHRMARRRPSFAPLRNAIDDLRSNRGRFATGFQIFFPLARRQVQSLGPEAAAFSS